MKRNLFVAFLLVAVSMPFTACGLVKGSSPTSPSNDWPPLPRPPADGAPYTSFFDPVNLSEDEWGLTLKFKSLVPPPGSLIFPVATGTQRNPCPEYCLYYSAVLSLAKRPPNNVSCNCPNWMAGVTLYLSYDGVNRGQHIGATSLGLMSNWELEATLGNEGTNFQIPFFGVPAFIIVDWSYLFATDSNNGGVRIEKRGTKAVKTWYTRG